MASIASIYSLCTLCGPHADKCAIYNETCAVPKRFMFSAKSYDRAVMLWSEEMVKSRCRSERKMHTKINNDSVKKQPRAYDELDFEDEWMD